MMKIGFIGLGNMSSSIISGIRNSNQFDMSKIYASGRDIEKLKKNTKELGINYSLNNEDLINQVDIIFLGVKPEDLSNLNLDFKDKTIVSMAAKTSFEDLINYFGNIPMVRIMPNLNASINKSSIAYTSLNVDNKINNYLLDLFKLIGKVWEIDEAKFSGFIALAGSSPALVYRFIDVLSEAGLNEGFTKEEALEIVAYTFMASSEYLSLANEEPKELIRKVTSKKGTTEQGLLVFDKYNFDEIINKAAQAIINKDKNKG